MRINSVEIKSFRSIANLKFPLGRIGLIVGANQSGKSNILRALKFFFEFESRTTEADKNLITGRDRAEVSLTFSDLNSSDAQLLSKWLPKSGKISIKKICEPGEEVRYIERSTKSQIARKEMQRFLSGRFVLIPSLRDAQLEFSHDEEMLFSRLIQEKVRALSAYRRNQLQVKWERSLLNFTRELNKDIDQIINEPFRSLGIQGIEVGAGRSLDQAIKTLEVRSREKYGDLVLDQHGHGIQSLLVINLYEAMAKNRDNPLSLYCIEEPENHLHSNLLVKFLVNLIKRSEKEQVLITSHSALVATRLQPESFIRVSKDADDKTICMPFRGKGEVRSNSLLKTINSTKAELLFAKKVVLCEGETECRLLPMLGARLGGDHDVVRDDVVFVHCDGEEFEKYIRILHTLKIPWVMLCDNSFYREGKWHAMAEHVGLKNVAKRLFKQVHPSKNLSFDRVSSILRNNFGTICLPQSIEDLILGSDNASLKAVALLLKECRPEYYKSLIPRGNKPNRENILKIMSGKKPLWARTIGSDIDPKDISTELKTLLINVRNTKCVSSKFEPIRQRVIRNAVAAVSVAPVVLPVNTPLAAPQTDVAG